MIKPLEKIKRLIGRGDVQLHDPGSGKCRDCKRYNSENGVCTVVYIGPTMTKPVDHLLILMEPNESCIYEGVPIQCFDPTQRSDDAPVKRRKKRESKNKANA